MCIRDRGCPATPTRTPHLASRSRKRSTHPEQSAHRREPLLQATAAKARLIAAKDRTFKSVRPNQGTAQRDCCDPQTVVVLNHQDRPLSLIHISEPTRPY